MLRPKRLINLQIFRYAETMRTAVYIEYEEGSKEREELKKALKTVIESEYKIPLIVGSEKIMSGDQQLQYMPHNHRKPIAEFYNANERQIKKAVDSVRYIHSMWRNVSHVERAAIWNRAADDIETKSRHLLNAANMLSQGKTHKDAEEDTCQLINRLRQYALASVNLSKRQFKNENPEKVNSTFIIRPIDGFIAAISPNNMTSVSLNLAAIPALMGNCVLWKPSRRNILSSFIAFMALRHAGLPEGVINFLPMNSQFFYNCCRSYEDLAGINFSGTTHYFLTMWEKALMFVSDRRGMPRVLGELSSKNFHFIHNSADLERAAEDTVEAAFRHSGQTCSSCSRLYVPKSIWPEFEQLMCAKLSTLKVGDPANFNCFTSAVAGRAVYNYILGYIESAKNRKNTKVIYDGGYNDSWGYFIEPTVIACEDPYDPLMVHEINGPVLAVYIFDDSDMESIFKLISHSTRYAFTGSVYANNERIIECAKIQLRNACSNLFINGKCTGSVHGKSLFSGTRYSGNNNRSNLTNNLFNWCSPQMVEETFEDKPKGGKGKPKDVKPPITKGTEVKTNAVKTKDCKEKNVNANVAKGKDAKVKDVKGKDPKGGTVKK